MNGWWWLLIGAGAYISAVALIVGVFIGAERIEAAQQRREGIDAWQTYCGEQR